jgi:hypothetical protein
MEDCVNCVVDDALVCRRCLADDLLRAQAQGDDGEVARLEYLIQLVEGVLTVVIKTVTVH